MAALDLQFASFLQQKDVSVFELNLRDKPLMFVVDKMVETKSRMRKNYQKQYSALVRHLQAIQFLYKCELKTEQVGDIFWSMFIPYLYNQGLCNNTINKLCGQLRLVIDWGGKHGAKVSTTYEDFLVPKDNVDKVVLSPSEVARIYYYDLDKVKMRSHHRANLKRVRDMIVLSCNLGQRHSDMKRITPDCFERNMFRICQQKTGCKAVVDIDRFAMDRKIVYEILDRYEYHSPFPNDISQYNKLLRELMGIVGFNDMIKVERKTDGVVRIENVEKWKMISSHTARRSFATYNHLRNMPRREIMRATGHKTEESFNKYIIYDD